MDSLQHLVERASRPGVLGLPGRVIEKACLNDMTTYFQSLERDVTALDLARHVDSSTAEQARHATDMTMGNLLRKKSTQLESILKLNLERAFKTAAKMGNFLEADDIQPQQLPLDKLGVTGQDAADYATQRAGELVQGINDTTRQKIADAVGTGIEERLGVDGTSRLIRSVLEGFSTARAALIATTEMNGAMSEATLRKLTGDGIEYKQWIIADEDADEVCQGNEDDGPIPVDQAFSSGDFRPPAHPNCRCAVTGARAPEEDDQ